MHAQRRKPLVVCGLDAPRAAQHGEAHRRDRQQRLRRRRRRGARARCGVARPPLVEVLAGLIVDPSRRGRWSAAGPRRSGGGEGGPGSRRSLCGRRGRLLRSAGVELGRAQIGPAEGGATGLMQRALLVPLRPPLRLLLLRPLPGLARLVLLLPLASQPRRHLLLYLLLESTLALLAARCGGGSGGLAHRDVLGDHVGAVLGQPGAETPGAARTADQRVAAVVLSLPQRDGLHLVCALLGRGACLLTLWEQRVVALKVHLAAHRAARARAVNEDKAVDSQTARGLARADGPNATLKLPALGEAARAAQELGLRAHAGIIVLLPLGWAHALTGAPRESAAGERRRTRAEATAPQLWGAERPQRLYM